MDIQQVNGVLTGEQVRIKNILRNTYLWMSLGLLCTGFVAYFSASSGFSISLMQRSPFMMFFLILVELGLVFYLSARIMSMSANRAALVFIVYSVLNGITLSSIFLVYTKTSIYQAFFVAGGAFAGMSLYAMTTKRDLSGLGKYFAMGLWGLIFLSIFSFFFQSSGFTSLISLVGLILFLGLTAYDTQIIMRWSNEYSSSVDNQNYRRISILGALKLYLDFINIFLFLLRFMGVARRD